MCESGARVCVISLKRTTSLLTEDLRKLELAFFTLSRSISRCKLLLLSTQLRRDDTMGNEAQRWGCLKETEVEWRKSFVAISRTGQDRKSIVWRNASGCSRVEVQPIWATSERESFGFSSWEISHAKKTWSDTLLWQPHFQQGKW